MPAVNAAAVVFETPVAESGARRRLFAEPADSPCLEQLLQDMREGTPCMDIDALFAAPVAHSVAPAPGPRVADASALAAMAQVGIDGLLQEVRGAQVQRQELQVQYQALQVQYQTQCQALQVLQGQHQELQELHAAPRRGRGVGCYVDLGVHVRNLYAFECGHLVSEAAYRGWIDAGIMVKCGNRCFSASSVADPISKVAPLLMHPDGGIYCQHCHEVITEADNASDATRGSLWTRCGHVTCKACTEALHRANKCCDASTVRGARERCSRKTHHLFCPEFEDME